MGNKMIGKAVNQFIQIAGMWALVWGALGGFISVRSQSCLVVAVVPYVDKSFLWIK